MNWKTALAIATAAAEIIKLVMDAADDKKDQD